MKEEPDNLSVPYNLPVASTFNVHKPQNACATQLHNLIQPTTYISLSLIRHVILRMGISANVLKLLQKSMWHGALNSCLTEFPMRMQSVSEYN